MVSLSYSSAILAPPSLFLSYSPSSSFPPPTTCVNIVRRENLMQERISLLGTQLSTTSMLLSL